jgi:hypothetical protein
MNASTHTHSIPHLGISEVVVAWQRHEEVDGQQSQTTE